jgi:hypothetical protein
VRSVVVNHQGIGWYAPRQEGSYEDTHIAWYWVGDSFNERPDTHTQGLGTPVWCDDPDELEEDD